METPDTAPAVTAAAVTKSDSTIVNCRALYVGTGGDVAVQVNNTGNSLSNTAVTFKAVPSGFVLPVRCYRVMSTNTTAADMVALF